MSLFWILLPAAALSVMLWCCLAISGDISEDEERDFGYRRS